ncbi:MAG: hypothetical protein A2007_03190 [Verrucomicrobia bacterium GWC2_42_7]|nr:MAG: hypothetical protein A2007_03190 [Verrucomicrobia bacterium GWC2_42_7]
MEQQDPVLVLAEFAAQQYADANYPMGNFLESREAFTQRTAIQIADLIKNFQSVFQTAGQLFAEKDLEGNAKKTIAEIYNLAKKDPKNITNLLTEEQYHSLFDVAMSVYDSEDYESAFIMVSAVMALFPTYIQPYIILVSITWFQEGFDAAIMLYEQLTKVMKNPLLFCCAADCYLTSEDLHNQATGKRLLEEALELANSNPSEQETYKQLIPDIEEMLASL